MLTLYSPPVHRSLARGYRGWIAIRCNGFVSFNRPTIDRFPLRPCEPFALAARLKPGFITDYWKNWCPPANEPNLPAIPCTRYRFYSSEQAIIRSVCMQIEYVSEYERFGKKLVTEFSCDISGCPLFFFSFFKFHRRSLCTSKPSFCSVFNPLAPLLSRVRCETTP